MRKSYGLFLAMALAVAGSPLGACVRTPDETAANAPRWSGADAALPSPELPGDVYHGYAYVRQACARCHSVAGYEPVSPNADAPTFASIANSEAATPDSLRRWLRGAHPTMPKYLIPPDEIENIVAYIYTLRKP